MLSLSIVLAGTVIAVASLYPSDSVPLPWDNVEGDDLVLHGVAYGVLVILGGMLWRRLRWVAVAVLVYSTALEGLQYFVPAREVHLSDLAANVVGVFAGLAIVALWRSQQAARELDDKEASPSATMKPYRLISNRTSRHDGLLPR